MSVKKNKIICQADVSHMSKLFFYKNISTPSPSPLGLGPPLSILAPSTANQQRYRPRPAPVSLPPRGTSVTSTSRHPALQDCPARDYCGCVFLHPPALFMRVRHARLRSNNFFCFYVPFMFVQPNAPSSSCRRPQMGVPRREVEVFLFLM